MPNNLIMRLITLTGASQSLGGNEVFSVDVSCPPANTAPVYFKVGSSAEIPWQASEFHYLRHIRLSDVTIRGTAGDTVTLVGGTW